MLKINELKRLDLGIKGENESKTLQIDMSAWASLYPNATAEILHKRSGDNTKTLTGATYDGNTMILTWIPTATDTFYEGFGVAEIRMVEGNVVKKSKDLIVTAVCPSVIDGSGTIIESTYQAFLNSVISTKQGAVEAKNAAETAKGLAEDAADDAEASADDAEAAAAAAEAATVHEPTIDDVSGNWMVWDQDTGAYVDTGVHAQGPQGEPGTIENVRATGIKMSILDDTTVYDAIHAKPDTSDIPTKVSELDNDEGYITDDDITGKADKVSSATSGNFAALDANGNLTDSGHKHSDYLTQHQDISGKVDKNQGAGNAGKALGIGNDGMVTPVPFSGEDFTGATSSTAGVHGYVPAPAAGDQEKVLTGDGTWQTVPGAKLITVDLTTITNVSGSYTGTTSDDRVTSDMKPVMLNLGTPSVIRDNPTVTCNNGSVTFTCSDVVGTTTAQVSMIKVIVDPTEVTSTEFDILNNRIGTLSSLTTTAKSSAVAAINELDGDIGTISTDLGSPSSASAVTGADAFSKINTLNSTIPTGNVFDEILIPAGSDINNYRTPGTFIVSNDSVASQISNMPYSASGRLIVMNRTTSSYIVQEYYPTTVAPIKYVRNYNNGTWTDWEQIALNSDITVIKTDYFTGTTSASGNISKAHASKVIVLSAWTDGSDIIVAPFPGSGAGLTGQYTWWFHLFSDSSSHSVIANTSVTIYYAYIEIE